MPEGVDARAGLYRSLLREARVLILLDNATDAEQVRPLLPGAGAARTVVTSRNQLAGLIATAAATPVVLAPLTAPEARRLLAFRLGDDRVESDPEAADAVVAACAGLPLALAVVAGRGALHPRFPLAALARDLFGAGDGPQATWPGPDTTTDVRAVFSGSYRWLSAPTAALFRLLPVAPGMEIDDSAAASLTGDTIAAARRKLAELANANLLTEHRPGWFGTHDLLRAYAADLGATVDDRTQRDAALVRILDHHLFTAAAAAGLLDPHRATYTPPEPRPGVTVTAPADESAARAWFASEQQTLLEAVRLAAATGHDTHAWQLAWALVEFLDRRGHWGDWLAMHTVALGAAERTADPAGIAVTRHQLARACVRLGRYPEAEAHLAEALSGYKKLGDEKGQAWVHGTFSFITDRGERYRDSVEHLQRSLELLRRTGDRAGEGAALSNLGWAYANLGEHDAALENCRQALRLQGEIDDRSGQAYSWDSIGFIHHRLGDHDEADRCYRQALELWRETGDRYNESETLTHLGDLQAVQGNRSAAMDRWESALAILEELGHPDTEAVRRRLGETPPDS
jgi:tetratricopeptide (TPR) repeat protein